jgi:acyl-coenzyme A thioesterase PaaI-like protein
MGHLTFRAQAHKHVLKTKISHIMPGQRGWLVRASSRLLKQGKQNINKRATTTNQKLGLSKISLLGLQN